MGDKEESGWFGVRGRDGKVLVGRLAAKVLLKQVGEVRISY